MEEERLYDVYAIEEDIEVIEDNKDMFIDTLYECYRQSAVKPFEKAIEHLIEAYRKVKEEKRELQNYMKEYLIPKSTINLVYIPKSKIKEKIEELEKELEEINEKYSLQNFPKHMKKEKEEQDRLYWELTDNIRLKIKVLQELLEEE